jgi:hypothetical protein
VKTPCFSPLAPTTPSRASWPAPRGASHDGPCCVQLPSAHSPDKGLPPPIQCPCRADLRCCATLRRSSTRATPAMRGVSIARRSRGEDPAPIDTRPPFWGRAVPGPIFEAEGGRQDAASVRREHRRVAPCRVRDGGPSTILHPRLRGAFDPTPAPRPTVFAAPDLHFRHVGHRGAGRGRPHAPCPMRDRSMKGGPIPLPQVGPSEEMIMSPRHGGGIEIGGHADRGHPRGRSQLADWSVGAGPPRGGRSRPRLSM